MRHIINILLLSLLMVYGDHSYAQKPAPGSYQLIVRLENAPFDSLKLFDYTDEKVVFPGKKTDKFTWEISIPDSTVQSYENMALIVSRYDAISNSLRWIRFITERDSTKIVIANVGVEDRINYIHGTYVGETIFPNENIAVTVGGRDTIVTGDMIMEDFKLIVQDDYSDISVRAKDPYYSWFFNLNGNELSYEDYLISYIEMARRYPNSRYLISSLARMFYNYKSKEDIQKVYENFSGKHKNTVWAKRIERFLYNKFPNARLPIFDKVNYEEIIQDRSKPNLVIFTASWCVPCIKEIPLLMEIYEDLSAHLSMTYVSIDEEDDLPAMQKIVREHHIPWRMLFAYPDIEKIKDSYFVEAIPHSILVHPNGEMEFIDVRIEEQRQKLYAMFL